MNSIHQNLIRNSFRMLMFFLVIFLAGDSHFIQAEEKDQNKNAQDSIIAIDSNHYSSGESVNTNLGDGWNGGWKLSNISPALSAGKTDNSDTAQPSILIKGTQQRNNPLRRNLEEPYREEELFVRFAFRYIADTQKDKDKDQGEFVVLWLDRFDGSDTAVHAYGIPNIGVHIPDKGPNKGKNLFMVRIGQENVAWSNVELVRDRTYQVVARLSKTKKGIRDDYDKLDLWVDPHPTSLNQPDASIRAKSNLNVIRWIGFCTGRKTEPDDQILVGDFVLTKSWSEVLSPSAVLAKKRPQPEKSSWTETVDFKKHVYPILKSHCFDCHKGRNPDSGYRLDALDEILGDTTGEPLVIPGKSHRSRLIELVSSQSAEEMMPPSGEGVPLEPKEIAILKAWIDQGLNWDHKLLPPPSVESDHWAFQPVARPEVPQFKEEENIITPVDSFIRRKQKEKGIQPNPIASRQSLIRRLYLDVIGLPPTPGELRKFMEEDSPDSYEKLVDELLASPHYGERWGRYWLDLARWTESMGYQHDIPRPYAWRYRDYVIQSFNEDKPYSRFLLEQVAGDELEPVRDQNLIASGFLAAARINGNQMDKLLQRNDVLVDIANVTASAILGLTMECAQCHNHKFDPISQRDYYRLHGFFINGQIRNIKLTENETSNPLELASWMPKEAVDFYHRERKKLKQDQPEVAHTWGYYSPLSGHQEIESLPVVNRSPLPYNPEVLKQFKPRILVRGNVEAPGPEVKPGWPEVLGVTPEELGKKPRTELAKWFADEKNPLVSRVWVNRLWQYHFGEGIVRTPSDFGIEGDKPSHPELLDWLANELMENNWSTKHIHREILLSSTYRQSKTNHTENSKIDPENEYLWRWPNRRLEAEAIRDATLVATGELKREFYGPSVPQEKEEEDLRRTVYLFQRRSNMPSVMAMFDAPAGRTSCSRRSVSTVALQPLYLLNSEFMVNRSQAIADKIIDEAGHDPAQQVKSAFLKILSREPTEEELGQSVRMISPHASGSPDLSLMQFCQALFNLNEFLYIP